MSQPFVLGVVRQPAADLAAATAATREVTPMKLLRLPGRFEWKILLALFIVASLPLRRRRRTCMSVTIGRIQAITDQHQEAVRQSLGGAVEVYKAYFEKMKDSFRERAGEIAASRLEHAADLAEVPDLLRARILDGRARRRRVVGAAGGDRRARARRRPTWSRCPSRREPRRAARPGADLRDPARDLRQLPGAARGDGTGARSRSRCCRWCLPRIFHGLGSRWWRCCSIAGGAGPLRRPARHRPGRHAAATPPAASARAT